MCALDSKLPRCRVEITAEGLTLRQQLLLDRTRGSGRSELIYAHRKQLCGSKDPTENMTSL